jgi:hypothetical protein
LRLGVQSTTGDHHDQQAKKEGKQESKQASGVCGGAPDYDGKKEGKQESKQASGVCGGAPDYDGKIKEGAHLCAKPRAGFAF